MHWVVGAGGRAIGASNMRDTGMIGFATRVGGWIWGSLATGTGVGCGLRGGSCGTSITGRIWFTGSGGMGARLGSRLVMKTAFWAWYCLRGGSLVGVVVVVTEVGVLMARERSAAVRRKRVPRGNIFGGWV